MSSKKSDMMIINDRLLIFSMNSLRMTLIFDFPEGFNSARVFRRTCKCVTRDLGGMYCNILSLKLISPTMSDCFNNKYAREAASVAAYSNLLIPVDLYSIDPLVSRNI